MLEDGSRVKHKAQKYQGYIDGITKLQNLFTGNKNCQFQYRIRCAKGIIKIAPEEDLEIITEHHEPLYNELWNYGIALDLYTVSSYKDINDNLITDRTAVGQMIHKLKYEGDASQADPIAELIASYIKNNLKVYSLIDYIIPVPPSDKSREYQPVRLIAERVSELISIPLSFNLVKTKPTRSIKELENYASRVKELRGSFKIKTPQAYYGKKVLIIDDVYRSGATLSEIARTLKEEGKVSGIYVITVAKTRVKR
jgi:predicted amidophosphoribosyltransferase